jgi:hypothetical protein
VGCISYATLAQDFVIDTLWSHGVILAPQIWAVFDASRLRESLLADLLMKLLQDSIFRIRRRQKRGAGIFQNLEGWA